MTLSIPGYDNWKTRAPDDERPERSFGWRVCDECHGDAEIKGVKCEGCAGCGGFDVDEDDMDPNEE